jgi:SHS2 domain-containing protein
MSHTGFEIVDHTADKAVRAWGDTLEALFAAAARGMFAISLDLGAVEATATERIEVAGTDLQDLLVRWLSELQYRHEVYGTLFLDLTIRKLTTDAGAWRIAGDARIAPRGSGEVQLGSPVKAVTYHALRIEETSCGWEAFIVFDV